MGEQSVVRAFIDSAFSCADRNLKNAHALVATKESEVAKTQKAHETAKERLPLLEKEIEAARREAKNAALTSDKHASGTVLMGHLFRQVVCCASSLLSMSAMLGSSESCVLAAAFEKLKMEAEKEDQLKTNLWNEVTFLEQLSCVNRI